MWLRPPEMPITAGLELSGVPPITKAVTLLLRRTMQSGHFRIEMIPRLNATTALTGLPTIGLAGREAATLEAGFTRHFLPPDHLRVICLN